MIHESSEALTETHRICLRWCLLLDMYSVWCLLLFLPMGCWQEVLENNFRYRFEISPKAFVSHRGSRLLEGPLACSSQANTCSCSLVRISVFICLVLFVMCLLHNNGTQKCAHEQTWEKNPGSCLSSPATARVTKIHSPCNLILYQISNSKSASIPV